MRHPDPRESLDEEHKAKNSYLRWIFKKQNPNLGFFNRGPPIEIHPGETYEGGMRKGTKSGQVLTSAEEKLRQVSSTSALS